MGLGFKSFLPRLKLNRTGPGPIKAHNHLKKERNEWVWFELRKLEIVRLCENEEGFESVRRGSKAGEAAAQGHKVVLRQIRQRELRQLQGSRRCRP